MKADLAQLLDALHNPSGDGNIVEAVQDLTNAVDRLTEAMLAKQPTLDAEPVTLPAPVSRLPRVGCPRRRSPPAISPAPAVLPVVQVHV